MSIKRWKLGWKRCDCVKCEAALTVEQTEDNCGWVRWEDHKEEVARLKAEVAYLKGEEHPYADLGSMMPKYLLEHWVKENARLKAEVENSNRINTELLLLSNQQASEVRRLTAELSNISGWGRGLESDLSHARVEISFLKAEVERLSAADSYLQGANENAYEKRCDELEAEVERLTKLCQATSPDGFIHIRDINAAKEGKPSV